VAIEAVFQQSAAAFGAVRAMLQNLSVHATNIDRRIAAVPARLNGRDTRAAQE